MLERGVAIAGRDAAIEGPMDMDFGSREAVAARLGVDLEAPAVPVHDVVVADDALVGEAADAFEIRRSRAPGFFGIAGWASEAAIVVSDEALQHAISGIPIAGMSQAKFAREAVLQHGPETLDTAFGLGALCGDEGDTELLQSAAELSGLAVAGELFVQ